MAPKLYVAYASPAVRAVLMLSQALDIELEHVKVSLLENEHLSEQFLKINPQHTVPTLVDNGHAIWDSHAINLYLIEKVGKETSLYPKDLYTRAAIHQRLFFDAEILFPAGRGIVAPLLKQLRKDIPLESIARANEVYTFLEAFLESGKWMVGNEVTLADIMIIANLTTLDSLVPMDSSFTKLHDWVVRVKALPFYSANVQGLVDFKNIMYQLLEKDQ